MDNQQFGGQNQRIRCSNAESQRRFWRAVLLRAEQHLQGNPDYEQADAQCRRLANIVHVARMRLRKAELDRTRLLRDIEAAERRIARSHLAEREGMAAQARLLEQVQLMQQAARERATTELAEVFSASSQPLDDAEAAAGDR
jgi:hypothetical protein